MGPLYNIWYQNYQKSNGFLGIILLVDKLYIIFYYCFSRNSSILSNVIYLLHYILYFTLLHTVLTKIMYTLGGRQSRYGEMINISSMWCIKNDDVPHTHHKLIVVVDSLLLISRLNLKVTRHGSFGVKC